MSVGEDMLNNEIEMGIREKLFEDFHFIILSFFIFLQQISRTAGFMNNSLHYIFIFLFHIREFFIYITFYDLF